MMGFNQRALLSSLAPAYQRRAQITFDTIARGWAPGYTRRVGRQPRRRALKIVTDGLRIACNALLVAWATGAMAFMLVVLVGYLRAG